MYLIAAAIQALKEGLSTLADSTAKRVVILGNAALDVPQMEGAHPYVYYGA